MATSGCPPGESTDRDEVRTRIVEFWNQVWVIEDLGGANGRVLELIERRVTESLSKVPPDIAQAESYTAQAMLMLAGWNDG